MKDLLILIDDVDLGAIDNNLLEKCDRLALSPLAMVAFERNKLPYLNPNDFYSYQQFRIDYIAFIEATKVLFSALDKKYQPYLGFPHPFTANIYWFLLFFTDIYYIFQVCERLKKEYSNIYLMGSKTYDEIFTVDLEFSARGLTFSNLCYGIKTKVNIFRDYLSPECIWTTSHNHDHFFSNFNRYRIISLLKRIAKKLFFYSASFMPKAQYKKKQVIFIIQDAYDIEPLKKQLSDFLFVNPLNNLLPMLKKSCAEKRNIDFLFTEELKDFIKVWFPEYKEHLFKLFTLYHNKILQYFNGFSRALEKTFDYYKPVALLYSIGASLIYEDLFAYVANQRRIPVFYFQHGGADVFVQNPYLIFFEHRDAIKKFYIMHSRVEREMLNKEIFSETKALGSPKFYNLFLKYSKCDFKKKKRILFCISSFTIYNNYKYLISQVPDNALLNVHKDVIDIFNKFNLKMDIKTHPGDENDSFLLFSSLLKSYPDSNIRALKRIYAEEIIKNYGLLILDAVSTVLTPLSFILDLPVIIYLKDLSAVQEQIIPDLRRRFYIAQNKTDLEKYIHLFTENKLPSKFSPEFIDKYIFPFNQKNPNINISDYIRSKINNQIKDESSAFSAATVAD